MLNSALGNSDIRLPRWRTERLRHYRRRFPGPRQRLKIRVTAKNINGLMKRGYLGPAELDDERAIGQALSLFLWDSLLKEPKRGVRQLRRRRQADIRGLAQDRGHR
jgi:hypothetical protein